MPVILALHGGGGSGEQMEQMTFGKFNRIADKRGALVVYPDGIEKSWNDGRTSFQTDAAQAAVDDVHFMRTLVTHLGTQHPIDQKRIYATGISNGGLLSYRLACDASDLVAAVAPVAANLPVELTRECRPIRNVPVAIFNGTDDPITPWIGGKVKVLWHRRGEVLSAQESFEHFMRRGDCALPITHSPRDQVTDDGTILIRHVARECLGRGEVRLYEFIGGGHTWPGGHAYLGAKVVGKVSREIDASEEIWSFFSKFSL